MKPFPRKFLLLSMLCGLLGVFPTTLLAQSADVIETTLPNGLRVIVAPRHVVPIVAVDIWVRAGTTREKPGEEGVAHYLEHVIFKGTPTRSSEDKIDSAVEDYGGNLNAATSYDWAHFYTTVPDAGFGTALNVLADVLQHSTISQDAVDTERPIILSEIDRDASDPAQSLQFDVRALTYSSDNAYSRPVTASSDQVKAITHDEVADYYHTYYVPDNVTVCIAGDVQPDAALSAVTKEFSAWKGTAPPMPPPVTDIIKPDAIQRQIVRQDASNTALVMGFAGPSVKNTPDVWTMDVLLTLLGQGGNNRLDTSLHRRKKLVTAITADFLTQRDSGMLTVTASLPTGNLDEAEAGIIEQVRDLRDAPVSESELAAAKSMLKSSYLADTETVSGKADSLGFYDMIDAYTYDVNYLDRVQSVTAQQLQEVARKYLDPEHYAIACLVPTVDVLSAKWQSTSHALPQTGTIASLRP